jgi:glutathione synthase/RimK-type ligase-like ATP-grasp enzyme
MAQKPKQLAHIGTTEFIDLPDQGIFGIPAKIDTGADSSAVWASNVTLEGDKLRYHLFAPGSPFYRPELVETKVFKTARVKSSFGDVELRYKVKFRVKIGGRTLTRWFNLADRSRNNYPVLLGKNFLKNTYMVDVSRRYVVSKPTDAASVLALGASKSTEFFALVGQQTNPPIHIACAGYKDLLYRIDAANTAVTVNCDGKEIDIASYGAVYFKTHNQAPELAAAAAEYLSSHGRNFFDREVISYTSVSKLTEYMRLASQGVMVPRSLCASNQYFRKHYNDIVAWLHAPFVLKEMSSNRGQNNYLIRTKYDYDTVLAKMKPGQTYIAQEFIQNDGFFRLYVLGSQVGMAIWRTAQVHPNPLKAHLNKPSGSVNARLTEIESLPVELTTLALQAAEALDRQVAGVDVVQDKNTQKWYVLEVNNAPQLRSGSFTDEKVRMFAEFMNKELNR